MAGYDELPPDDYEIDPADEDYEPDEIDVFITSCVDEADGDEDALHALLAQGLEDKSGEDIAALVGRVMKGSGKGGFGRGRGRGRGRGTWTSAPRSPSGSWGRGRGAPTRTGTKKEAVKKCEKCKQPGHTIDQCWEAHPELIEKLSPSMQEKAKKILAKRGVKLTLITSELLLASFTELTDAAPTCAVTDTGAMGRLLVCGTRWLKHFIHALGKLETLMPEDPPPKIERLELSRNFYRFGAGTRDTIQTLSVPIRWQGGWKQITFDVTKGNLPPLLGYELQGELAVITSPRHDLLSRLEDKTGRDAKLTGDIHRLDLS